jgi:hypothetical protein
MWAARILSPLSFARRSWPVNAMGGGGVRQRDCVGAARAAGCHAGVGVDHVAAGPMRWDVGRW